MRIRFRVIFLILIAASLLCALTPLVLGLGSTALNYQGKCYGFTDGVWDCPWTEYARNEIFWSAMFLFMPAIALAGGWLATLALWFLTRQVLKQDRLQPWQLALLPLLACLFGGCLLMALSFIRR